MRRYYKMTADDTEQGRAFRLNGRPDALDLLVHRGRISDQGVSDYN